MIAFFINDIAGKGGTERVTCLVANMLAQRIDQPVEILSLHQSGSKPHFELSQEIHLRSLFSEPGRGIARFPVAWYKLHRYLKRNDVDIIIDVDGILDLYSIPASIRTHTKVVSWEHFNYNTNPDVPYRKISRPLAARFASSIVTLTEQDKASYQKGLEPNLKSRIVAIHNPMQIEHGTGYDSDARVIVSAGRLTYQKGFDLLIKAAQQVLPKHPKWQWYILGEGEQRDELEQMINEYGLAQQVHMPGMVNIDEYFSKAAFFVMSSRFEGLPMVLLEAKSYNLPIVSFDCQTGPSEIVANGINGMLIPSEDTDALAKAVEELIDSRELRIEYSDHANESSERFSPSYIAQQWENLIQSLL